MIVKATGEFVKWFDKLKDLRAKAVISDRIDRVIKGNLGDYKSVGEGVFELRIRYSAGYRIYYTKEGNTIVILLCGGDKATQKADIKQAKKLAEDIKDES